MNARVGRGVGVALVVAAAVLLVTATSGISVVSMDRSISVQVADDDAAATSVEPIANATGGTDGEAFWADDGTTVTTGETDLLVVSNRLGEPVTVASIEAPASSSIGGVGTTVGPGETATLAGTVACDRLESDATATVELSATGVDVAQSVELGPTCQPGSD